MSKLEIDKSLWKGKRFRLELDLGVLKVSDDSSDAVF